LSHDERHRGTNINQAQSYCKRQIPKPRKTHLVLISDPYEGGNAQEMLARAASLVASGVNVIALLALSDSRRPGYHDEHAAAFAAMGCPVFACTPDQFPDLMAAALQAALLLRHGVPEVAAAFCELRLGKSRAINYGACGAPIGTDAIIARQTPAA